MMAGDSDIDVMDTSRRFKESDRNGNRDRHKRHRSKDRVKESHRRRSHSREHDRHQEHSKHGRHDREERRDRHSDKRKEEKYERGEKERHRPKERREVSPLRERSPLISPRTKTISPDRSSEPDLTPEERDARTVFCMQLAARIKPYDLEEFFSTVGQVKDVKLIVDNKSRRSKGIAYVEFKSMDSVPLAMGLNGQRLLGVPIMIQPSHAERNRQASAVIAAQRGAVGPLRLYVGSLHYNITEEMLREIFEPFGQIEDLKLMKDHQTQRSLGYCFLTYRNSADAKKAMEQMNGFELAGRPMKIGHVTEKSGEYSGSIFDVDEVDRTWFGLGATGRLQLMAKLAEGTGMELPKAAANALNPNVTVSTPVNIAAVPPIATQCFMLSNMFDPAREIGNKWETEIRDDVIDECNKHGGVLHIYVDKSSSQVNVYVKCPSIASAVASVNSLHGRYFAGKQITAAYVPLPSYHSLFPDALKALQFVMPSSHQR